MQRAMQPPQELQQLQEQQQVRQLQQQPQTQLFARGDTQDLQEAWEQATAAAASLLASYDVRYDVQRPPRLSSSRGRLRGSAAAAGGVGPDGLGPGEVCLTAAAAAAAAAKARRVRKPQVSAVRVLSAALLMQVLAAHGMAPIVTVCLLSGATATSCVTELGARKLVGFDCD
jgi:hypothetical protein